MGWYHSHPFDVGINSHCFLSQTDLTTQLQWQRAEDPHGNPFLAVVIDPLRSLGQERTRNEGLQGLPTRVQFPRSPTNVPTEASLATNRPVWSGGVRAGLGTTSSTSRPT